jgi:predicted solute-binding protein
VKISGALEILRRYRVGCVSYLNARPLMRAADDVMVRSHPAELADGLLAGELDAALIPVRSWFDMPDHPAVDGVCIGSDGPVQSVLVAHGDPLDAVNVVWLDPASRTSNHLTRLLFKDRPEILFRLATTPVAPAPGEAAVVIGDRALQLQTHNPAELKLLDLGTWWKDTTGLPFVFAVWAIRPEIAEAGLLAAALRCVAQNGEKSIAAIVAEQHDFSADFALGYLQNHIRRTLDDRGKQGIAEFSARLAQVSLTDDPQPDLTYL